MSREKSPRKSGEEDILYYMEIRAALGQSACFAAFTNLDEHLTLIVHRCMGDFRQYMVYLIEDHQKVVEDSEEGPVLIQETEPHIVEYLYVELERYGLKEHTPVWLPLELLADSLRMKFAPDGRIYEIG